MTQGSPDDRTFDVAISFLSEDQSLAQRLHDELAERWEVFLFTERQEDLVARDGVEELSRIFGRDSELNVVLFREGWGESGPESKLRRFVIATSRRGPTGSS